jgi:predicted nuclease of predicted toxin-antitoxin system
VSSVRYYVDEHVGTSIVRGLRRRGADVMTVTEARMRGRGDEAHLALALTPGRVIVTQDRDLLRLAAGGVPHAGIVYTPQGAPISTIVSGLPLIHSMLSAEEMVDTSSTFESSKPRRTDVGTTQFPFQIVCCFVQGPLVAERRVLARCHQFMRTSRHG